MSLILYHSIESTCAQKVRLVLSEKQVHWNEVRLNLRKGDQFDQDYLKLNSKAVVPTLVHGDCVVRESSVINEYLDEVFSVPALKPEDPYDRARMRLLVKTFDDDAHPAIGVLSYAIFLRHQMNELKSPAELAAHFRRIADPMRRERQMKTHKAGLATPAAHTAVTNLRRVVKQLDEALQQGPWLAGETFSLADAAAAPYIVRAKALNLSSLWDNKAGIARWLEHVQERVARNDLTEPWGSASLQDLIARHVNNARSDIQKLLAGRQ
jgi:glutathione S-transferase